MLSDVSGAYRHDDNPEIVFVFAMPWASGGEFSALRLDGVWRHASLTVGDLEDRYRAVNNRRVAARLLSDARVALDPETSIDRFSIEALKRVAERRVARAAKHIAAKDK